MDCQSVYGIMADNFFTSFVAAKELLKQQKIIIGIMKLNQKEVPVEFHSNRKCVVLLSVAVFSQEATMVSYMPKCKQNSSHAINQAFCFKFIKEHYFK